MFQSTATKSQRQHRHQWHTLEKDELIQKLEELMSYKEKIEELLKKSLETVIQLKTDNQGLRSELDKVEEEHRELKQKNDALRMTWTALAGSAKEERLVIYHQNQEIARLREENTKVLDHHSQRSSAVSLSDSKLSDEDQDEHELSSLGKSDDLNHCSTKDLEIFQKWEKQFHSNVPR